MYLTIRCGGTDIGDSYDQYKDFCVSQASVDTKCPYRCCPAFLHAQARNDLPIRFIDENGHIYRGQTSPPTLLLFLEGD